MDDAEQTVTLGRVKQNDAPPPTADEVPRGPVTDLDANAAEGAAIGLVSLSFITTAIRRRTRFWCILAVLGLLLGAGLYLKSPPPYQATSSVLLTLGPGEDINTAIQTEVAMAGSRPVAAATIRKLGLRESVTSLLEDYTATPVTNLVITITVDAKSDNEAIRIANALSTAYLQFRAGQLRGNQQLQFQTFNNQIAAAKAALAAVTPKLEALQAQPTSPNRQDQVSALQAERTAANASLASLEQNVQGNKESIQAATASAVNGSKVLNVAAVLPNGRKKMAVEYVAGGLIGGLAVGMGLVTFQAVVSDRLRRRDDVAHALGAPVRLSLGRVRLRRVLPGRSRLTDARRQNADIQQIVMHLRSARPRDSRVTSALALVPVDSAEVAALSLVELALTYAKQDERIIVADLSVGRHAARLLGVRQAGVHKVKVEGAVLVVVVPETDDVVPTGPLPTASLHPLAGDIGAELTTAHATADVLLSFVSLDPALGGEHLATWAAEAVVIVTAGRSSSTKIHATGELIRSAGTSLVSAILIGADKNDESLGSRGPAIPAAEQPGSGSGHHNDHKRDAFRNDRKVGEETVTLSYHDRQPDALI